MEFALEGDRSQLVFIEKVKSKGRDMWVEIASPIGLIEDDEINDALEMLHDKTCGGLVKVGDRHFVRANVPIDHLPPEQFVTILDVIVGVADEMEMRFVGSDDN
ncbi:MAG: hypothetical protein FWG66_02180 [Spirochaetes bacterium]|nr:hypothetical protein [Spirochaetota bacterium]